MTLTRGNTATLLTGKIDACDFHYRNGLIAVKGRDNSAKLHNNKTAEKWTNKRSSLQSKCWNTGLLWQGNSLCWRQWLSHWR